MNRRDFETILLTLESTPALVSRAVASATAAQSRLRPAQGGFSLVENVWHLADLEREGYGTRIRRILCEDGPALLNFDGDRFAQERSYQERDIETGLTLFTRARRQNLDTFARLFPADWKRSGAQEGVGRILLADIPRMMAEHDRSHGAEIADLMAMFRGERRSDNAHPTSAVA